MRTSLLIPALVLIAAACDDKGPDFFSLSPGSVFQADSIPPQVVYGLPDGDHWFNTAYIPVTVIDNPGGSGVNASTFTAMVPGVSLPWSGGYPDPFAIDVSQLTSGAYLFDASVMDIAGNTGRATRLVQVDFLGPRITLSPVADVSSVLPVETVEVNGSIADDESGVLLAAGALYFTSPSATCGDGSEVPAPIGTGPGEVSENMWNYGVPGPGGQFQVRYDVRSNATQGGDEVFTRHCLRVYAKDGAVDVMGDPNPNRSWTFASYVVGFSDPPPPPPPPVAAMTATPATVEDEHQVGVSPCPQNVGSFVLANTGTIALTFSIPQTTGLSFAPLSGSLSPGATTPVNVAFTCAAPVTVDEAVTITGLPVGNSVEPAKAIVNVRVIVQF